MTDRKLKYVFKENDPRNHIFTSKICEIEKLEISTINKPSSNTLTTTKTPTSASSYTIKYLAPILDQGDLGDCVANAFNYCINVQTGSTLNISRLYLYANCRILDFTPLNQDDGTTVQTACRAIKNYGAANEKGYPYNTQVFSNMPPLSVYQGARYFRKFTYTFVSQNITSIKNCLNTYNVPIIFGVTVYDSFMTNTVSSTGNVPMPDTTKEQSLGGHCMCIVGYNDSTQMFTCANSWGTYWGKKGYCYIPYNYLLDPKLACDFCFTQFIY